MEDFNAEEYVFEKNGFWYFYADSSKNTSKCFGPFKTKEIVIEKVTNFNKLFKFE